ncbi:TonB-dependent receptor plug domain-containing protein [Desulfobacula toluolica]|uniref:BtuB: vitamin B12 transporter, cobalamin receptor n=1 Tax=Desulfobacula toluolica (strain DSM 7467 / Tol2) TaxID=651182 RepID=K0NBC7_DESTT|nr:TonB-dependent receptor [Desulfobacula toluolica]CCK81589.1 BtuB: vitamin B12 transporter, cobalamin receptor [Desulfobacula toluolica Tol2]
MFKHRFVKLFAVLLFMWSLPAWSEEIEQSEKKTSILDTMVVTAGRVEEKKEDVTTNITIVTEEEIQQSFAQDLGDLLSKKGFMIREYPNSLVSVEIRGFRTETHGNDLASHVLILINGRRAGTGNLAKIMLGNVERIEIIRGPGSVQYGASAMGGVVNIITKQGAGKPSFYAEGTLGSWDYQQASAGASGQFKAFDFSFDASKSSQDDYDTANGDKYYNTGFDSKKRVSFNTGWTFAPENRIGFSYTGYEGDGIGNPDYLSNNDLDNYVDHAIKTFDLVYDGQTADGFLIWNLRYFNGKDEYETFDPENYGSNNSYFRDTDQQGAQAQLTAKWDFAHITAGADWTNYAISNTYTMAGEENTYDNPAAFLMAKIKLMDNKLILSAGGRYDKYEIESDDGQKTDETNWSSNLGAVYKLAPGLSVRANFAEAFRMPTADQLYMFNDYSAWGFGIWSGNPDLKPEESKTYEIGMDFSRAAFSCGMTYFYTDFKNKIDYSYIPAEDLTRYENVEGATISGIEGSLQLDIGALLDWSYTLAPYGSFTYLTEYADDATKKDLQYTPNWTASYGLKVANSDIGFSAGLNFSYIGEQDITDYEGTGATALGSHTVADLTVSKTLLSFEKYGDVSLKAEIQNLFNKDYAVVQGYPMPGRTFFAGLKYLF